MPTAQCPICGKGFDTLTTVAMPFCSPRCRKIDLGRWLDERYGVTVQRDEDGEPGARRVPAETGGLHPCLYLDPEEAEFGAAESGTRPVDEHD